MTDERSGLCRVSRYHAGPYELSECDWCEGVRVDTSCDADPEILPEVADLFKMMQTLPDDCYLPNMLVEQGLVDMIEPVLDMLDVLEANGYVVRYVNPFSPDGTEIEGYQCLALIGAPRVNFEIAILDLMSQGMDVQLCDAMEAGVLPEGGAGEGCEVESGRELDTLRAGQSEGE